ncbi:MAG: hypothetical protein RLZZ15_1481 [Verrucomicrobiota bacterium]|jgi:hypothetical protein
MVPSLRQLTQFHRATHHRPVPDSTAVITAQLLRRLNSPKFKPFFIVTSDGLQHTVPGRDHPIIVRVLRRVGLEHNNRDVMEITRSTSRRSRSSDRPLGRLDGRAAVRVAARRFGLSPAGCGAPFGGDVAVPVMSAAPIVFSPSGTIQTFAVPAGGTYVIEAAGAQGGDSGAPGVKGARVSGMFHLKKGERLKIVAGVRGTACPAPHGARGGGGGASMVWIGSSDLPSPIKLMLSARGGKGGLPANAHSGDDPAPLGADGLGLAGAAVDPATATALTTQWTRGAEAGAAGGGKTDRGGYNAGAFRQSAREVQAGDGYVSIAAVAVPGAPGGADAKAGSSGAAAGAPSAVAGEIPTPTVLPEVTPRPKSWEVLFGREPKR